MNTESSSEILSGLSFTSTRRSSRGTSHRQVESLSKSDIASVSKWSDDETTAVANELVVVPGLPVCDS